MQSRTPNPREGDNNGNDAQALNGDVIPEMDLQSAGCWVMRNVRIKLGISQAHAKQLREWSKAALPSRVTSGKAAWLLLNTALSHLPIMERLLISDQTEYGQSVFHSDLGLCGLETLWEERAKAAGKASN